MWLRDLFEFIYDVIEGRMGTVTAWVVIFVLLGMLVSALFWLPELLAKLGVI